ncbi:MAG: ribosome-associated toxin RatA of RatAB toxin-antitoxin module [Pseudohongiellaceae bacterium]|jgi:ribosome-associated toxin RatA of RatAB toxin-antitoxin module
MATAIERSALLPYTAEQMYCLINDVEAYPQYLDGCVGAQLISSSEFQMEARLDLAKAGLSYSFTTRNTLTPNSKVTMELVDGPFTQFKGEWQLQALSKDACKLNLQLEFELKGKIISLAAKKLFEPMANNLVDAMVKRAKKTYGS